MKVLIGFPHPPTVHWCFAYSLISTISKLGDTIMGIKSVGAGAMGLDRARNKIAQEALDIGADWLLMIDTDMKWKPEDVHNLLQTAHPTKRPVVGGLCFRLSYENEDVGPIYLPVMYRFPDSDSLEGHPVGVYSGVEKVDATGAAFLAIHRSVLKMVGSDWFSHYPGQPHNSEDFAFMLRLRDAGIPVHVDTRVKIGHSKDLVFGEREYVQMLQRMESLQTS